MVAYWNVKGHGHGPLDFHAPTKGFFNLQDNHNPNIPIPLDSTMAKRQP